MAEKKKRKWRKSKSSTVIRLRLPNEVVKILDRRVESDPKYKTRGSYCKGRLIYDLTRKHIKHRD